MLVCLYISSYKCFYLYNLGAPDKSIRRDLQLFFLSLKLIILTPWKGDWECWLWCSSTLCCILPHSPLSNSWISNEKQIVKHKYNLNKIQLTTVVNMGMNSPHTPMSNKYGGSLSWESSVKNTHTLYFLRPSQLFNCYSIVKNAQLTTTVMFSQAIPDI